MIVYIETTFARFLSCKTKTKTKSVAVSGVRVKVGVLFSELLLLQSEPENIITIFAVSSQSQSFGKLREKKFNKNERTSNGKTSIKEGVGKKLHNIGREEKSSQEKNRDSGWVHLVKILSFDC